MSLHAVIDVVRSRARTPAWVCLLQTVQPSSVAMQQWKYERFMLYAGPFLTSILLSRCPSRTVQVFGACVRDVTATCHSMAFVITSWIMEVLSVGSVAADGKCEIISSGIPVAFKLVWTIFLASCRNIMSKPCTYEQLRDTSYVMRHHKPCGGRSSCKSLKLWLMSQALEDATPYLHIARWVT